MAASVIVRMSSAMGSGTVIGVDGTRGCVLTCRHVAGSQGQSASIRFPSGKVASGTVLAVDSKADLAAIEIAADASTPWAPVAEAEPERLAQATQVGYPHGHGPNVRQGRATGYRSFTRGFRNFEFSFQIQSGDSGSGAFVDGKLVAVMWGTNGQNSLAVGQTDIVRFLATCWKPKSPSQPPTDPNDPYRPLEPPDVSKHFDAIHAKLDGVIKTVKAMEGHKPELDAKLANADTLLGKLHKRIDGLEANGISFGGKVEKIDGALGKIQDGLGKVHDLSGRVDANSAKLNEAETIFGKITERLGGHEGKIAVVEAVASKAADLGGWASYMPWIVGGAVGGPIGIGLAVLGIGLKLRRSVKTIKEIHTVHQQAAQPSQVVREVIRENPPLPQLVSKETSYIPFESPSKELSALKDAMDALVLKYPGTVDAVETIKAYASQIQSGMAKK